MICQADAVRLPFADRSFDLVVGSPPYLDARLYLEGGRDRGIARKCAAWVEWMLRVTAECLRVSRGLVIWVCAGKTKDWNYQPAPEGMLWKWWEQGGHCFRPVYWNRVGIPGSGSGVWYRSDIEHCLCFKRPGRPEYANPTVNGHTPKWAPGGAMSHRLTDGTRRNQWGSGEKSMGARSANGVISQSVKPSHKIKYSKDFHQTNGTKESQGYDPPALADPGNLLRATVGRGHMGHDLAHENEAPFPVKVPGFFIASHTPPGGSVLDPFLGSGTTIQAAMELGRRGFGCDLRMGQCQLARRRVATVTGGFAFE